MNDMIEFVFSLLFIGINIGIWKVSPLRFKTWLNGILFISIPVVVFFLTLAFDLLIAHLFEDDGGILGRKILFCFIISYFAFIFIHLLNYFRNNSFNVIELNQFSNSIFIHGVKWISILMLVVFTLIQIGILFGEEV